MRITLLGATGSIGASSLEVIARNPDFLKLYAAAACSNVRQMISIIKKFRPARAAMSDPAAALKLKDELKALNIKCEVLSGDEGVANLASDPMAEYVIAAIVGAAGLKPVLAAASRGALIGLANKEALVMSGTLFFSELKKGGAKVFPIDSEHSAIFQCLPQKCQENLGYCNLDAAGVHRIILTASGGPFFNTPLEDLASVTAEQALSHPIWSMGPKITIDSATMMNKGLEYIEAHCLFNAPKDKIEVIIHPQSVVHSMVSYKDGAVLAQLGIPDMKTPIARALAYPDRIECSVAPLDFASMGQLTFFKPDFKRYPCLKLAIEASKLGQGATTVLNAANEVAVAAFLKNKISYPLIHEVVSEVLGSLPNLNAATLEEIFAADCRAREKAREVIKKWESL